MKKSIVAVLKTKPETFLEDYAKLLDLAQFRDHISFYNDIALKINISWHHFYPACSTTPWQLEGVIKYLLDNKYDKEKIYGAHNRTVVVSAKKGEIANKHKNVLDKYNIKNIHLYENEEWVPIKTNQKLLVLNDIYPEGIKIPKRFIGNSIIQLPTMKTHVFTKMTGAMKNAFGGLLSDKRHWTHSVIHETLVDLLIIQKEIHKGVFAVMDGTFAGDGPGPRCMRPHIKNYILASADQVAIDAVAAKMMGFEPGKIDFLRIANEHGLGECDINKIEIKGEDIDEVNFHFKQSETFASRGQKLIYHGALKPFEKFLLRTKIAPWSYWASILYHDVFWYNLIGRKRVKWALNTDWGRLFKQY